MFAVGYTVDLALSPTLLEINVRKRVTPALFYCIMQDPELQYSTISVRGQG